VMVVSVFVAAKGLSACPPPRQPATRGRQARSVTEASQWREPRGEVPERCRLVDDS
jgi:hypothetical protein